VAIYEPEDGNIFFRTTLIGKYKIIIKRRFGVKWEKVSRIFNRQEYSAILQKADLEELVASNEVFYYGPSSGGYGDGAAHCGRAKRWVLLE
jgi:hypothetical protein